jgi:hypothetical protein
MTPKNVSSRLSGSNDAEIVRTGRCRRRTVMIGALTFGGSLLSPAPPHLVGRPPEGVDIDGNRVQRRGHFHPPASVLTGNYHGRSIGSSP